MTEIHLQAVVDSDGALVLRRLPSLAGHRVHVLVRDAAVAAPRPDRYPLRGKPLRYEQPFDGHGQSGPESARHARDLVTEAMNRVVDELSGEKAAGDESGKVPDLFGASAAWRVLRASQW